MLSCSASLLHPSREHHLTNCYHVIVRYGYLDAIDHGAEFVEDVVLALVQHILDREGIGGPGAAVQLLAAMPTADSSLGSFVKSLQLLPEGLVLSAAGGGKGETQVHKGAACNEGAEMTAGGEVILEEEGVVVVVPVVGANISKVATNGGGKRAAACLSAERPRVMEDSISGHDSKSGLISDGDSRSCKESAAAPPAAAGSAPTLRRSTLSMRRRSIGDAAGAAIAAADAGYRGPEGSWYCPGVNSAKKLSAGNGASHAAGSSCSAPEGLERPMEQAAAVAGCGGGEAASTEGKDLGADGDGEWELTLDELQALRMAAGVVRSYRQRSVHLVGRVALKVQSRNIAKRVLLGWLYTFLHDAGRQLRDAWSIPPKKLVELGMEVVV